VALIALARALGAVEPSGLLAANVAGIAALLFVWIPERHLRARGEGWAECGLPWSGLPAGAIAQAWARGIGFAVVVCAVVFPALLALLWACARLTPTLPRWLVEVVAPCAGAPPPALRLPPRFPLVAAIQLLVVALPEELFYRGWMQTTWAATGAGRRVRVLGANLGAGFVTTQLLFALGHLVVPQAWRIATFLPGLLFGWVRERSGGLVAPIFVHAFSNLFLLALETSLRG
jgi:membrane protease YdiL (CAAX protease family)